MTRVYVGVGSNVGRAARIRAAIDALHARYGDVERSPVYESAALTAGDRDYYNLVVAFDTQDDPDDVARSLKRIEAAAGRRRGDADVAIDLDLLLFGSLVTVSGRLTLPHPDIERYAFVLRPLAELAPDLEHPVTGVTLLSMWQAMAPGAPAMRDVSDAIAGA